MNFSSDDDLKIILHPFLFVLQEGKEIKENFLDYSLLMLQVSCRETIRSPGKPHLAHPLVPRLMESTPQETARKTLIGRKSSL